MARFLGSHLQPSSAYCYTLLTYWLTCWTTIAIFHRGPVAERKSNHVALLDWLAFAPVFGVMSVAWAKGTDFPKPFLLATVVAAALMNGITEEKYWRQMFVDAFYPNRVLGALVPWLFFSLWHLALLAIPGVEYQGGPMSLVGGGAILGAIWGIAYWINRSFWIVASAHATLNVYAFVILASDNAWTCG
jgi:membrane protease YdiL (CAAX protease family)